MSSLRFKDHHVSAFNQHWMPFFIWGIVLVILGCVAVGAATMTTFVSVILLGFLLMVGGLVLVIDAFSFWRQKGGSFFLLLLLGVLYCIVGIMLVQSPIVASVSLTLLLGIFYLVVGLFRVLYSLFIRAPSWNWSLFSGMVSFILGVLILTNWPQSSLYIIGLFVGIDLLFTGWAYIMASLSGRSLVK